MDSTLVDGAYNHLEDAGMEPVPVELDRDLVDLLEELGRPVREVVRELIVLGLYAQGELSSGRAAELLGRQREDLICYASGIGIPYFQITAEEIRREVDRDKL